ncbi:Iron-sulfur-binding protein OS=Streptomyces aurantiogriseus OX=66870 GN=GCM10010251_56300 PE=4 SV=1 [Streptomyces aurantiogriseus]
MVVATHYPVFDRALLFTRLSPRRELVVAAPIDAARAPRDMYITQEQNTRSVRTAPLGDGRRLLVVTGEHFTPGTGQDVEERFERLAGWATDRFGDLTFTHRWATQDNDSTDSVPLVGPLHPGSKNTYVATGFGGWGMSSGIMAGRLLSERITGRDCPWSDLYDPRRIASVVREGAAFLKHRGHVARHFVGDRLPTATGPSVDEIAPATAPSSASPGKRCAVHRDEALGVARLARAPIAAETPEGIIQGPAQHRTATCAQSGSRPGSLQRARPAPPHPARAGRRGPSPRRP